MTPTFHPLDGAFGVEVRGVDLAQPVPDRAFREIERAFREHAVVVFRDQRLDEAQQVAFSRRFGELDIHWLTQFLRPSFPEVLVISNVVEDGKKIGISDAGRFWHSDLSYTETPSRGALLYAIEIPQRDGGPVGDTCFANIATAFDALPGDMRDRLSGLRAAFNLQKRYDKLDLTDAEKAKAPEVVHNVVRTHPLTGRKCLYVNEAHTARIVDLPEAESRALLAELYAHCARPEFVYRHRWRVGDLLMWDNYATQHLAHHDYALPQRRLLYRTTLKGTTFV
jgi:taurine dioxygenase